MLPTLLPGWHLAVVDPPYNIDFDYDGEIDDKLPEQQFLDWCSGWLQQLYRLLAPTGSCWVVMGDKYVSEVDVLAKAAGFYKRSHVINYYTFGVNCTNKLTPSHVHLLYYTKHRTQFTFNAADLKVPSMRQLVYKDKRQKAGGRLPDDTWLLNPRYYPEGYRADEDTWTFSRVAGTFKQRAGTPNQLPEHLVGRIIRACSNPGDYVIDCCAGGGTVPTVAKKLGRNGFGIDLSETFVQLAQQRYAAAKIGDDLAGPIPHGG